MMLHVIFGNLVRDPLEAEIVHQPVEQCRAIVTFDCAHTTLVTKFFEQVERACEAADLMNQANGMIYRNGIEVDCFLIAPRPDLRCGCRSSESNQRHQLALGISVTVDVALSGLDRPMTGQQLNISQ